MMHGNEEYQNLLICFGRFPRFCKISCLLRASLSAMSPVLLLAKLQVRRAKLGTCICFAKRLLQNLRIGFNYPNTLTKICKLSVTVSKTVFQNCIPCPRCIQMYLTSSNTSASAFQSVEPSSSILHSTQIP